jgi:MFS family permease
MSEALPWVTMGLLFSVYQSRGSVLTRIGGNELGPFLSAAIIQSLKTKWAFWIVAMFCFGNWLTMLVYFPETLYLGPRSTLATIPQDVVIPKKTWKEEFKPFQQLNRDVRFWRVFFRPFVLLGYPTILWASVMYGLCLAWNLILASTTAQLFGFPYLTSE